MPLELCQCWEVQATLHTHVLLTFLMLQLMSSQFTGISKASSTHTATVWLDVTMLHHVPLQVTGLGEGLVAHLALVRPHAPVRKQVCVQMAQLLEQLPAQMTPMRFDPVVAQDMRHQVVLRGVGLLAHTALPSLLLTSHVHVVAFVHIDTDGELLWVVVVDGRNFAWRGKILTFGSRSSLFTGVEHAG